MKPYFIVVILIVRFLFSINTKGQHIKDAVVAPEEAIKSMASFMDYYQYHLNLESDFIGYDVNGKTTTKNEFLKELCTGNYLPLQLNSKNETWKYRLYKLNDHVNRDVKSMLKQTGLTFYGIFKMVGRKFPEFHYVDLNGNIYSSENTKGKIVVVKAWFISCVPCVAEMPELNKLTEDYKQRKDILFVSMAFDSKKALENFLKRKTFKYAVVPVKEAYLEQALHVTGYPVHWIINKQGIVVKMTYDHNEMIAALRREVQK